MQGLLRGLTDSCIDIDSPDSFIEWTKATQRHHKNWLKKQSIHRDYTTTTLPRTGQRGAFFWNHPNQPRNNQNPQGTPTHAQNHDPNAMDTSATVHKATTEAEKEKAQKEGRCFECGKQGHLTRNCLDRKPRTQSTKVTEAPTSAKVEEFKAPTPAEVAKWLQQSSSEDKEAFIKAMVKGGEDMGFLKA